MGRNLKDNLRMAVKARASQDLEVKTRMDSMVERPPATSQELSNQARQHDTATRHDNTTQKPDDTTRHLDTSTRQHDTAIRPGNTTPQSGTSIRHDNTTRQHDTTTRQDNPPPQLGSGSRDFSYIPVKISTSLLARTPAQKTLVSYFKSNGSHVANYLTISNETGIPRKTVRDVIEKFVALGWITKKPWVQGSSRGLHFEYFGQNGHDNTTPQFGTSIKHDDTTR